MKYREDFLNETVALYKKQLELIRNMRLSKNVENITHQHIVPFSTYSPWYDDKEFIEVFNVIKENTLVDTYRCYELWDFIKRNLQMQGDVLEVGVWRGGTGCLIAKAIKNFSKGKVYLADTFSGIVKASKDDTSYKGGEHSDTSVEIVKELVKKLNLDNVEILQGIFPDEINFSVNKEVVKIKLCHIDVDTYSSAKDVFEYIWPNIVKGGAVIFDDYGFWGCEGVTKLCNEISLPEATFIHNVNGHGIFIKI
jgi:O-methyltransferase